MSTTDSTDTTIAAEFWDREAAGAYFLFSIEQALYAKHAIQRLHGTGWWVANVVPDLCEKLKMAEKHQTKMRALLPSYPREGRRYATTIVRHMWIRIKDLHTKVYGR